MLGKKLGVPKTIIFSMLSHVLALTVLSLVSGCAYATVLVLMFWAISAWLPGPLLRFNVLDLAPDAPQVIMSLYNSIIQFGFACGAALGGLEYDNFPTIMLSWSAAAMVAISLLFTFIYSYGAALKPIILRVRK
ncbi:hypothetical protein OU798_11290 [Prolixibacteraceae bacterium Z1-6]|uniref:MFS transporter n=1 Tax=Draconibacterium aestuarii TaxID=2998507 RepID=A0A9X3J4Y4_9BACT|nr:hypothetical protein [Prolixibacteraceae bacterium Z1-6]